MNFALNQVPIVEIAQTERVADSATTVVIFQRLHQRAIVVEILATTDEVVVLGGQILAYL